MISSLKCKTVTFSFFSDVGLTLTGKIQSVCLDHSPNVPYIIYKYINLAQELRFIKPESSFCECSLCVLNTFEREVLICPALRTDGCCYWGDSVIGVIKEYVENAILTLVPTFLVWQKVNEYISPYLVKLLDELRADLDTRMRLSRLAFWRPIRSHL